MVCGVLPVAMFLLSSVLSRTSSLPDLQHQARLHISQCLLYISICLPLIPCWTLCPRCPKIDHLVLHMCRIVIIYQDQEGGKKIKMKSTNFDFWMRHHPILQQFCKVVRFQAVFAQFHGRRAILPEFSGNRGCCCNFLRQKFLVLKLQD